MTESDNKNSRYSDPGQQPNGENRRGKDRRTNNKARLRYLLFNGRREQIRREEDSRKVFFSTVTRRNFLRPSPPSSC